MLILLASLGVARAGRYDSYDPIWLNWSEPPKVVAAAAVQEDGLYHIVFQAQAVNDTAAFGKPLTVMLSARMFINGEYVHGWTENITPERHYAMVTLVKVVRLLAGDTVEIDMRGDCSRRYPNGSVMVLTGRKKWQFDVVRIAE